MGMVPPSEDIRYSLTPFQMEGGGCGRERGTHGYYMSGTKSIIVLTTFPPGPT